MTRSARSVFLLLGAIASLPIVSGYGAGYHNCDRQWAGHGTNNPGNAGGFQLAVTDSSGNAVSAWVGGTTYTVTLSGGTFRGLCVASFAGSASTVSSWSGTRAGAFSVKAGDTTMQPMSFCSGGVTQKAGTDKTSATFDWTAPATSSGTVTMWVTISTTRMGNNYEVKLELPEAAPSPGASVIPPPSATPSPSQIVGCTYYYAGSKPSPSSSPTGTYASTVTPTYSNGGWSGKLNLGGMVLSWTVLPETKSVTFSAYIMRNVWLSFAFATKNSMTYPRTGVAYVGTPADAGVANMIMTTTTAAGMKPMPNMLRDALTQQVQSNCRTSTVNGVSTTTCTTFNTSMTFTRSWDTHVCEDKIIDPNAVIGIVWAFGVGATFDDHHDNVGFARFRLLQPGVNYVPPSPSPTPSRSPSPGTSSTSTPTRSPTPTISVTPSRTPTPSPSTVVDSGTGGGSSDGLSGSTVLDDISLSWRVDPTAQTADFSMSAANRVWLSLARASSFSMIAPAAGLSVSGIPAATGTGSAGSTIRVDGMAGYDLASFTSVPLSSSGVTNAVVSFDGTRTWFNFTRPLAALTGGADLSITATSAQGFIYARGYTQTFDAHEIRGYKLLRLQTGGAGGGCTAATCSYHGACAAGGATCVCDSGYVGDFCDSCDPLFEKQAGPGSNFTCTVRPGSVRVSVAYVCSADTADVGELGSAARADVQTRIATAAATLTHISSSRINLTLSDRVVRRLFQTAVQFLGRRSLAAVSLTLRLSVGPAAAGSTETVPADAIAAIQSALLSASSPLGQLLSSLGIVVDVAVPPEIGYIGEAPPSLAGSLTYPVSLQLMSNLALAWNIDTAAGVIHLQLAYVVPSVSDRRWFGISFNSDSTMIGGDAVAVEPGLPAGMQVNRYRLNGKTMSTCPAANDATVLTGYNSFDEIVGTVSASSQHATSPAVALVQGAIAAGSLTTVATFSRSLTAAVPGAGSRSIDPAAEIFITWAWGPSGALVMGPHTTAMSGALRVNLASGTSVTRVDIPLKFMLIHGLLGVLSALVMLPLSAIVTRESKATSEEQQSGQYAWWRRAHKQAAAMGTVLAAAAFISGSMFVTAKKQWFQHHAIISIVFMALLLLLLPLSSRRCGCAPRQGEPSAGARGWRTWHILLGVAVLLLGVSSVFTGVYTLMGVPAWYVLGGVAGAVVLGVTAAAAARRGRAPKPKAISVVPPGAKSGGISPGPIAVDIDQTSFAHRNAMLAAGAGGSSRVLFDVKAPRTQPAPAPAPVAVRPMASAPPAAALAAAALSPAVASPVDTDPVNIPAAPRGKGGKRMSAATIVPTPVTH